MPFLAVALLATLRGVVVDRTTGQPLPGVAIVVHGVAGSARATSGRDGRFVVRGLHAGTYALDLSSDDVPPATEHVRVDPQHPQPLVVRACSTTLDYTCAPAGALPGGG